MLKDFVISVFGHNYNIFLFVQTEIDKLRQELSTDADAAAQALLNSKVDQLQAQLEHLQVSFLFCYGQRFC